MFGELFINLSSTLAHLTHILHPQTQAGTSTPCAETRGRETTPAAADLGTVTNAFPPNAAVAVQSGIICT